MDNGTVRGPPTCTDSDSSVTLAGGNGKETPWLHVVLHAMVTRKGYFKSIDCPGVLVALCCASIIDLRQGAMCAICMQAAVQQQTNSRAPEGVPFK